ncbi:uncharacterized protein (DUF1330 family) [Rhodovulum imhoffii]|uniref:Uncharacterized protein (DUF1330 family) n=1 Tax=Rhodovulum imhoffii TaxID=365340 RepID=A0A2T5BQM5_9RHOB|nr:DUF1330 domain-containing protein [Rhodovulum imhoffii]MBK5933658.1 hypothetical protein [Rhodovulum imhoffii]PTN01362.1 uncharacterized protein (DUF1330 family) [Rhodovulum imhoffii]
MTKAYSIVTYLNISDPDRFAAYAKIAGPAIEAEGGRFIARGEPVEILEGTNNNRVVIIEFESTEAALSAYRSASYQSAVEALGDGARRDYRIVPGC